jgi:hypothetical protein
MPRIELESNSQAHQESFVLNVLNFKKNGTYIEIGGYDGFSLSNTSLLETKYGWTGFAVEIDKKCSRRYNRKRRNKCITADAVTFDYAKEIENLGLPQVIDYLQVDIEPALQSLQALMQVMSSRRKFRVITFEHDVYASSDHVLIRHLSRELLSALGYKLIAGNVKCKGNPFEDWWIHPDLVSKEKYLAFCKEDVESEDLFA